MFRWLSQIGCLVFPMALPLPAMACDTALLLTIDVSNSIDTAEYRLQTDGLADALLDGEVAEALLQGKVALAVVQWSGMERQDWSIPWARMHSQTDIDDFAIKARTMPRAFVQSDTAPAEAIRFAATKFDQVPDCTRRVIDVSGDGTANSGADVRLARNEAEQMGITINGIAIESMGVAITGFFERAIITRDGFVITARGHREYPDAIRRKIIRETARVLF
jgi:Ca-activated chloride channel family protein